MSALWRGIKTCGQLYLVGWFAYGGWVFVLLQFRTCGFLGSCPDLPTFPSRIVNVVLALLPDVFLYSFLMSFFRGMFWLPNLLLAIGGYNGKTFLDWLFVRNAPPMEKFYWIISAILP